LFGFFFGGEGKRERRSGVGGGPRRILPYSGYMQIIKSLYTSSVSRGQLRKGKELGINYIEAKDIRSKRFV